MNEKDLIKACLKGDARAQRLLYERFGPQLMGLCLRYAGNREDAEEIFHDTFIKVFGNLKKFKNESSLKTWISRIGINTALDYLRKKKKAIFIAHISDHHAEITDSDIEREISLEAETAMHLMRTMPLNQQIIINLFVIEEMSHKEIASQLQISEEASRVQLSRAKKALIQLIQSKFVKNEQQK